MSDTSATACIEQDVSTDCVEPDTLACCNEPDVYRSGNAQCVTACKYHE